MCVVTLQLNDPLQKVIWLKNSQASLWIEATQQKRKRKISTLYERRMGSLFIIISSSAQPGYLMFGLRVRQHFIFVSVHIPKEYFSIPKHCTGQGSIIYELQFLASVSQTLSRNFFQGVQGVVMWGWWCHLKHFQLIFSHTDILFPRSIASMPSEGESCRGEMLCGFSLRGGRRWGVQEGW